MREELPPPLLQEAAWTPASPVNFATTYPTWPLFAPNPTPPAFAQPAYTPSPTWWAAPIYPEPVTASPIYYWSQPVIFSPVTAAPVYYYTQPVYTQPVYYPPSTPSPVYEYYQTAGAFPCSDYRNDCALMKIWGLCPSLVAQCCMTCS